MNFALVLCALSCGGAFSQFFLLRLNGGSEPPDQAAITFSDPISNTTVVPVIDYEKTARPSLGDRTEISEAGVTL